MRVTKLLNRVKHLSYTNRLKEELKLPTLKYRRTRTGIIDVYKMLHGI